MRKRIINISLLCIVLFSSMVQFSADERPSNNYNYDTWGDEVSAAPTFEPIKILDTTNSGTKIGEVVDVATDEKFVYVVDQSLNKVDVFNDDFEFVKEVKSFNSGDTFNAPASIATNGKYIIVADNGNSRLVVFDDDFNFKSIITKPDAPGLDSNPFKPLDVAISQSNDIYVIVQGVYEGIIQLDLNGQFIKFIGTNKVKIDPVDLLFRQFATDEQLAQMKDYLPTEFSSMSIDEDGFLYTTTTSDENEPIKKINSSGENVLVYPKGEKPKGDLIVNKKNGKTQLSSIAVNKNGLYSTIDATTGRIFTYDEEGYLLSVYGNIGEGKYAFRTPSSLAWFGDNQLIVTDKTAQNVVVLEETEFLKTVSKASIQYYANDMEKSKENWIKALNYDSNYELAYLGLGRVELRLENYKEAQEYFKLANNKTYYSKAFENVRKAYFKDHFVIILGSFILALILLYRAIGGENE